MLLYQKILQEFSYDSVGGCLVWKLNRGRAKIGMAAGTPKADGHIQIGFYGKIYAAHRLIWLYHNGELPPQEIDHLDRNPANNRIENLRLATRQENLRNRASSKLARKGSKGVRFHKGAYEAYISINKKFIHLGRFSDEVKARIAYNNAAKSLFGEFACVI